MHLPPTGGFVERNRIEFYVERAMKTRFKDGREISPPQCFMDDYSEAMDRLFQQTVKPEARALDELMPDGHLNVELFYDAVLQLNGDSNPGYPLVYLFKDNKSIDVNLLYQLCDELLNRWLLFSLEELESLDEMQLFEMALAYPSMVFVKGEGTSVDKIARLIYGVSVVMNVVGRVLMGSFLNDVAESWSTAQHKVGMDFVTQEGLEKLMANYDRLFGAGDVKVKFNDIQGWEYQVRYWMSKAWYVAFAKSGGIVGAHLHLLLVYCLMEAKAVVIDSDGYIHRLPFYVRRSGVPSTHIQNSEERAALADTVNGYWFLGPEEVPSLTNGDDCNERGGDAEAYASLGFVITDEVELRRERMCFSSQIIERGPDGITRYPDGLAKLAFSAASKTKNADAVRDILMHCRQHPGFQSFLRFVQAAQEIGGGESVELPKQD